MDGRQHTISTVKGKMMTNNLKAVLHKMAELADLSYDNIKWHDSTHLMLEWSESAENAFKRHLYDELMARRDLRKEFMQWPRKDKAVIKKVVDEFVWIYGFKTIRGDC